MYTIKNYTILTQYWLEFGKEPKENLGVFSRGTFCFVHVLCVLKINYIIEDFCSNKRRFQLW